VSTWLCLRFSQLPLQCLSRSEEQPIVVLARQRVVRANDCAAALGIREGMGGSTVRALAGDDPVQLLERDESAEHRCLQQLCCWAYSITPTLYTWREDCLQLEIGGCLNLFRGLDALLAEVDSGISSRGYHAQYGLASTPGAAWLLSFANTDAAMALQQPLEERLAPLPLTLLDDFSTTVDSLRRAGLHTLGDILALPTTALGRRCGKAFTHFLQQVLGEFRLVPFSVGDASPEQVAEVLDLLWGGPETLIVISSDLSHYHDYETARRLDAATTRAIEALRPADLDYESACGRVPVSGLLPAHGKVVGWLRTRPGHRRSTPSSRSSPQQHWSPAPRARRAWCCTALLMGRWGPLRRAIST